jgi:RNA-splicing ligase RtcB
VQLEVFIEGEWHPVIRYDCAHGYAHVDRYNIHGETRKEEILLAFAEALTAAEEDLEQNWKVYRERFLEGRFP